MESKTIIHALKEKDLITTEVSKQILKDAEFSLKPVEDIIFERRLVDDVVFAQLRSSLLKIPYKKVDSGSFTDELMTLIPEETVFNYKAVPISKTEDMLVVGMLYPDDEKAQEALRFIAKQLKVNLGVYLISHDDYIAVLRKYSPFQSEIQSALRFMKPTSKSIQQKVVKLEEGGYMTDEAPIIKIVASTLREAVSQRASDIHIEPQRERLRIRFRLDGDLHEMSSLPIELIQPIVSRIKVMSELQIDETRRPQDGRFRTIIQGRDIDFRVATFPTPAGEKIALRVLDPTIGLRSLEDLGLAGRNVEMVKEGIRRPFGMILITGPTGSGKTTTLYALLQLLNKEEVNILSLEDPVEYFMEGINQSQVRPDIGYDFASGLRQILRQDPDVIMVGEIRDNETAGLAGHSALTGHIVLSTLHTNNSVGVIPRLVDMKVDAFLLPPALSIMASQRLVSHLCPDCKKASEPMPEISSIIKKDLEKMDPELKKTIPTPYQIYHAVGCAKCHNKGYVGRIALFEVFQMTPELGEIISDGANFGKILQESKRQGMVTLREDGIAKALNGVVTIEEVLRETSEEA